MKNLFNRLFTKILAIIIIVLFIMAFREMILNNKDISILFGALMETLPFAKIITDLVCKILKCQYAFPGFSSPSIFSELIRLAFMACLQPIVVGFLTLLFLPVPSNLHYSEKEAYMRNNFGYRVKELCITVFSAPLLAIISSKLSFYIMDYLSKNFGKSISNLVSCLITLVLGGISVSFLTLVAGIALSTAIGWRIFITFGGGMIKCFVTNALCILVYIAVLKGVKIQIASSVLALIFWIIIFDFGIKCLQRSVVANT